MQKFLFILAGCLFLVACASKNEQYYRTHPKAVQEALQACPSQKPELLSCNQLADIAKNLNALALELQTNPQHFGQKILSLQQTLASQQAALRRKSDAADLSVAVEKNEQALAELLAVVRWLESPES